MRTCHRIAASVALLALLALANTQAHARERLVQIAPTSAGLNGTITDQPLLAYLLLPKSPGRHPAVILLHGCGGFNQGYVMRGRQMQQAGYVTLVLDSLGDANACGGGLGSAAEAIDADTTLHWLASVRRRRNRRRRIYRRAIKSVVSVRVSIKP